MNDPIYLTTADIAKRYGVNTDTARRWMRTGTLPAIRIGGSYRVRLDVLQTLEKITSREGTNFLSLCDND